MVLLRKVYDQLGTVELPTVAFIGMLKFSKFKVGVFTSRSTARVILGQVLRIATCGTRTHRGDSL